MARMPSTIYLIKTGETLDPLQARPSSAGLQRKEEARPTEQQQKQEGSPADAAHADAGEEEDELHGRLADAVLLNEELEQCVAQLTKQAGRMRRRGPGLFLACA